MQRMSEGIERGKGEYWLGKLLLRYTMTVHGHLLNIQAATVSSCKAYSLEFLLLVSKKGNTGKCSFIIP